MSDQRPVSPDGHYEWDGTEWVPRQQPGAPAAPSGQPQAANPYGQPTDPYGQAANPYGQPPAYGQPPFGQPQKYGASTHGGFAGFGQRLAAYLIDVAVTLPLYIAAAVTNGIGASSESGGAVWGLLTFLLYVAAIAVQIWNVVFRQGRTGWSLGKQALGIRLVSDGARQPIGPGKAFLRQLAHILDALPCYIGFLLPLFTAKKQTIADMVMKTVVVEQKKD